MKITFNIQRKLTAHVSKYKTNNWNDKGWNPWSLCRQPRHLQLVSLCFSLKLLWNSSGSLGLNSDVANNFYLSFSQINISKTHPSNLHLSKRVENFMLKKANWPEQIWSIRPRSNVLKSPIFIKCSCKASTLSKKP